jgi:hypothetical protein
VGEIWTKDEASGAGRSAASSGSFITAAVAVSIGGWLGISHAYIAGLFLVIAAIAFVESLYWWRRALRGRRSTP